MLTEILGSLWVRLVLISLGMLGSGLLLTLTAKACRDVGMHLEWKDYKDAALAWGFGVGFGLLFLLCTSSVLYLVLEEVFRVVYTVVYIAAHGGM